tara:strand:- start:4685 stop:5881 length:1197 start_codon:yes stop_codon:yes gene_type:complete
MNPAELQSSLEPTLRHPVVLLFVVALGACVGSFLNVVIHRLPRNMRVDEPKRSFCPACETQIPGYLNIPIVSWIMLKGKCAKCGAPIAVRYVLVEGLTAVLFLAVWLTLLPFGWGWPIVTWILVSLLISATFIDFEHYIIPDSLNWGGAVVALLLAGLLPLLSSWFPGSGIVNQAVVDDSSLPNAIWYRGLMWSAIGGIVGWGLLKAVVEGGKLAFGRKIHEFEEALPWKIHQPDKDGEPQLEIGTDVYPWSDLFSRPTDRLVIESSDVKIDGTPQKTDTLVMFWNRAEFGEQKTDLDKMELIEGTTRRIQQPREAMGLGDVKFVMMIGAFLGWQATVFTLIAGSVFGSFGGIGQKFIANEKWNKPIPFGPYLALGALVFLFWGPQILNWYRQFAGLG